MLDFVKNISSTELIIIVLILVILFGGKAIIGLARTSGESVRELKKIKEEFTKSLTEDEKPSKRKS